MLSTLEWQLGEKSYSELKTMAKTKEKEFMECLNSLPLEGVWHILMAKVFFRKQINLPLNFA